MATAAKTAGAQPPATRTYKVTGPLEHDGKLYAAGDEVELADAQATPLLGLAIEDDKAKAPS